MFHPDTPGEARLMLETAFGPEWEAFLMAEGIVGGTDDDDVMTDKIRVRQLMEREHPEAPAELCGDVADAWFMLWLDAGGKSPGGESNS